MAITRIARAAAQRIPTSSRSALNVSAKSFRDPEAFDTFAKGKTLTLRAGQSFTVGMTDRNRGAYTYLRTLTDDSPFTVRYAPGSPPTKLIVSAKPDAKKNASQKLAMESFEQAWPGRPPSLRTPFTLKVAP